MTNFCLCVSPQWPHKCQNVCTSGRLLIHLKIIKNNTDIKVQPFKKLSLHTVKQCKFGSRIHLNAWNLSFLYTELLNTIWKSRVTRSLAPLSWFPGSRKPTVHVHQCCRFQSYVKSRRLHAIANEIYKRNLHCVNHIPGIHDNGPPRTTLWRLTLTAY